MKSTVFTVALLITLLASCSKEEPPPVSNSQLLTKQPWILKSYTTIRLSDGVTADGYAPMSLCYKDDEYVFNSNNTYEGNAGATKCDPTDSQIFQTGTWQFTNSETKLKRIITNGFGVGTVEFSVMNLTATELKINTTDGTYNHILTYSH